MVLVTSDVTEQSYITKAISSREIISDKQRFTRLNTYIKNLDGDYNQHLFLNQLIVVFNTFHFGWACYLLEVYSSSSNLGKFYAVMFELGFNAAGCDVDEDFLKNFRKILDENPKHSEVLRSYQRAGWW